METLITIFFICAGFYVLLRASSYRMRAAATKFITAIIDRRFVEAYEIMHPDFQSKIPKEHFEIFLAERGVFNIKEIKRHLGDYSIGTQTGHVTPIFFREDNIYFPVDFVFVYTEKAWRIYALDVRYRLNPVNSIKNSEEC